MTVFMDKIHWAIPEHRWIADMDARQALCGIVSGSPFFDLDNYHYVYSSFYHFAQPLESEVSCEACLLLAMREEHDG